MQMHILNTITEARKEQYESLDTLENPEPADDEKCLGDEETDVYITEGTKIRMHL